MPVISVNKLSKTYRSYQRRDGVWGGVKDLFSREYNSIEAVKEISFSVEQGEILGYIGPNGAGKSTSIKMLTGILKPTSGEMDVLGYHPFRQRQAYTKVIGVVFGQRTQLWWDIAVMESLKLLANIYDVSKSDFKERLQTLSDILELDPLLRLPVRKLSLGQRIRCDLAASLIHNPKILFLDEPTIGLDAVAKNAVRDFLRKINQEFSTTVILTTHDLPEIEELCRRILVLDRGQIIYDGSLEAVKTLPGLHKKIEIDFVEDVAFDDLKSVFDGRVLFEENGFRRVSGTFEVGKLRGVEIIKEIVARYRIADISIGEPTIEEVVMKIYREGR